MGEKYIDIRSVKSLLTEKFNIPRYQRGYRWEKDQIINLLDDIFDYGIRAYGNKTDADTVGDFYCLQPIVVKRNEQKENGVTWWDVIDGQQRLTTIFIIIKYIQSFLQNVQTPLFVIDYETRNTDQNVNKGQGCEFLNNITFVTSRDSSISPKNPNTDNVDYYHMDMCSIYVEEWFVKNPSAALYLNLILTSAEQKNVSVIWYEADKDADNNKITNPIDVFTRLNIGKIPLTDSELIKAFLLQGDIYKKNEGKYTDRMLFEIAKEWDNIEYHLQKNAMWAFLNNVSYEPESRIEYLFRLISDKWNLTLDKDQRISNKEKHFECRVFEKYIFGRRKGKENDIEAVVNIFDEIKLLFSVLDEWYNDRRMYHYIGFLVCQKKDEKESEKLIKDLFDYFQGEGQSSENNCQNGHTKNECLDYVKSKIREVICLKPDQKLETLNYNDPGNYDKLLKILLFLNIESTIRLEKEDTYFPFHLYKKETPSIEHIHPQTPEEMDYEQRITWLKSQESTMYSIINNTNRSVNEKEECKIISEKIKDLLLLANDDYFKNLFGNISREIDILYEKILKITNDQTDTLSNYALIGKDTNSKLSNYPFKHKREIIINIIAGKETGSDGKIFDKYIPVCTRNVFQKYYTLQPDNIILWDGEDRNAYFNAMKDLYYDFAGKADTGDNN